MSGKASSKYLLKVIVGDFVKCMYVVGVFVNWTGLWEPSLKEKVSQENR